MAKMAELDGEVGDLSPEELESHLSTCHECSAELVQLNETNQLFQSVSRNEQQVDLWSTVSAEISSTTPTLEWKPFAITAVLLLGYKLVEMLPAKDPGMAITLLPLIIFGCLMLVLRENPFRINTELVMEK